MVVVANEDVGDLVLRTPVFRGLRASLPRRRILLMTTPAGAALLEGSRWFDRVVTVPGGRSPARVREFTGELFSAASPDLAIVPRFDADPRHGALLALWSGAPWRVGYGARTTEARRVRNAGVDALLTQVVDGGGVRHEVERGLDVLAALPLPVEQDARLELPGDAAVLDGPPPIALGLGSGRRAWPAERFREVAARFGAPVVELDPSMPPREALALLRSCRAYLGAGSELAHLAAAAGIPAVVVSCHPPGGSPDSADAPERFRPWGVPARVVQPDEPAGAECASACVHTEAHCILRVGSGEVAREMAAVLNEQEVA